MYATPKTTAEKFEQLRAEARARLAEGVMSQRQIAKAVGVSRTTVANLADGYVSKRAAKEAIRRGAKPKPRPNYTVAKSFRQVEQEALRSVARKLEAKRKKLQSV